MSLIQKRLSNIFKDSENGFSVVELIISITIIAIVFASFSPLASNIMESNDYIKVKTEAVQLADQQISLARQAVDCEKDLIGLVTNNLVYDSFDLSCNGDQTGLITVYVFNSYDNNQVYTTSALVFFGKIQHSTNNGGGPTYSGGCSTGKDPWGDPITVSGYSCDSNDNIVMPPTVCEYCNRLWVTTGEHVPSSTISTKNGTFYDYFDPVAYALNPGYFDCAGHWQWTGYVDNRGPVLWTGEGVGHNQWGSQIDCSPGSPNWGIYVNAYNFCLEYNDGSIVYPSVPPMPFWLSFTHDDVGYWSIPWEKPGLHLIRAHVEMTVTLAYANSWEWVAAGYSADNW